MDHSAFRTSDSAPATAPMTSDAATPPVFLATVAVFVLLALVPTIWPELDLAVAGSFMGPEPAIKSASWWWVEFINANVPMLFRSVLALCFLAWLWATLKPLYAQWRLPLAFVVVAGILGPGAVVNLVFKDHWQRARPYQVEVFGGPLKFTRAAVITDQCDSNCSFVSGHVACGAFLVALGLVHRRRRVAWAAAGTLAGLTIAFARFSDKAHWFSDALWAFPITLGTCWLVWKALIWLYARPWRTVG